jgi:hypothetical protein
MSDNATFLQGRRRFFRRYPVTSISDGLLGAAHFAPFKDSNKGTYGEDDLEVIEKSHRIVYCDFGPDAASAGIAGVVSPGVQAPVALKLRPDDGGTSVPVYYLKYDLNHNRRITLRDRRQALPIGPRTVAETNAINAAPWKYAPAARIGATRFFITDCVDGCSIYIEGAPELPTVYHINANRTLPPGVKSFPPASESWAKRERCWRLKWATMDERFRTQGTVVKTLGGLPGVAPHPNVQPAAKLESRDYMFLNRPEEQSFEADLPNLKLQGLVPNTINGHVFGIRAGGVWSFWVQKRVLVQYHHHQVIAPAGRTAGQKLVSMFTGHAPYSRVPLGNQWLIRAVDKFWPTVNTGRLVA